MTILPAVDAAARAAAASADTKISALRAELIAKGVLTTAGGTPTPTPTPAPTPAPAPTPTPLTLVSPAFFMAANGNDSNAGTQAAPFLSFETAQAAMRAGTTKTCYVRGGTYLRTSAIRHNAQDNGTAWLGYLSETAIVDGGGTVTDLFLLDPHSANITIDRLTIRNCLNSGVHLNGYQTPSDPGVITGCVISNCYIHDIANGVSNSGAGNTGGIRGSFATRNNIVRNNRIENTFGPAVSFVAGGANETIAGNIVEDNYCKNLNAFGQSDTGGIYILDRGHGAISTDQFVIRRNYIENPGNGPATKGIYTDDHSANVLIENNIVCGVMKNSFQLHGGDHIMVRNNIFVIDQTAEQPFFYQEATLSAPGNWFMTDNFFQKNIIYHGGAYTGGSLWLYETDGQVITKPTVSDNIYYAVSGALPNTGDVIDTSPHVLNPMFTSPSTRDFSFTDGGAAVAAVIGFSPINQALIGPQA